MLEMPGVGICLYMTAKGLMTAHANPELSILSISLAAADLKIIESIRKREISIAMT